MTHQEMTDGEVFERYALGTLPAAERRAFQEHYFECDECFARAQESARFVAAVRHSARAGVLSERQAERVAPRGWMGWLRPAFAATAFATLALACVLGWLLLARVPALREEAARERRAREESEREYRQRLSQADEALARERQRRESEQAARESERAGREAERAGSEGVTGEREVLLAQNRTPSEVAPRSQANTPLVILDSVRGAEGGGQQLTLGGAPGATIWVEVAPGGGFDSYRMQIFRGGRLVETVRGARPNPYGAVAVTVPSRLLRPGLHVVKLFGVKGRESELVGEYDLNVRGPK
jgi:hypothetical protein